MGIIYQTHINYIKYTKINVSPQLHHKSRVLTLSTVVQAQKAERKLIFVPLLFVFLRVWGTIRFFLLIADGPDSRSYDWLLILQVSIRIRVIGLSGVQFRE